MLTEIISKLFQRVPMNRGEVSLFGDRLRSFLPLIFVLIAASLMIHAQVLIVQAQVPLEGQSDAIEKSMRQSLPKEFPPESRSPKIIDKNKPLTHKAPANAPTFFIKTIKLSGNTVISDERLYAVIDLGEGKDEKMKIALSLSYIEKPLQPDAFQLKENDF